MKKLSFIGAGKMAAALISCIHKKRLAKKIIATGRNEEKLNKIKRQFKGIETTTDNKEAAKNSDIVFICVKPQDIDIVLSEIKDAVKNQLIVSIAAGVKTKLIESILKNKRIIRVMPNINCLVGEMAAGFSAGKYATRKDIKEVQKLLDAGGTSFYVKEELMEAVTAISACTGFFAYFIKAMADAAIKNGLKKEVAYGLVVKTALGTGKLMLEKNLTPEEVIKMVASKKGVTLAGLRILKQNKVDRIIIKTLRAAIKRSRELGK